MNQMYPFKEKAENEEERKKLDDPEKGKFSAVFVSNPLIWAKFWPRNNPKFFRSPKKKRRTSLGHARSKSRM